MAKKKKHNRKPSFQEFVNSLKRENTPRVIDTKIERQYFLIVTEGEKTEPNYFKGLTSQLPDYLVQVIQRIKVDGIITFRLPLVKLNTF